jgi:protein ImuB
MKLPEQSTDISLSSLGGERETSQALNLPSTPGLALRRFRPALPAHIEFREQRPALLRSALFNGALTEVRGPFLSSGNWWDAERWAREEWDVQAADGTLFRLFRSPQGCFMEGVYD